jgi:hypothetical protein
MSDLRWHLRGHFAFCFVLLAFITACPGQKLSSGAAAGDDPAAAPPVPGFNFSLESTSQHSSVTGWSNLWTPTLSFRVNDHFSVDASIPWVLSDNAYVPVTVKGVTTYPLQHANNILGDLAASGTYELVHDDFGYNAVATLGFATGNSLYGLSANTTTYNITNHLEYGFGRFTPDVEIGEGNSSTLVNQEVRKAYTAVGQLANFQAGSWIDLPWKLGLDLEAYEALPVGKQNIYGTVTKKTKGKRTTTTTLASSGVAEDNGFTTALDIPIGAHLVLSGGYDRSLRQHDDIANISITYTLRGSKKQAGK